MVVVGGDDSKMVLDRAGVIGEREVRLVVIIRRRRRWWW